MRSSRRSTRLRHRATRGWRTPRSSTTPPADAKIVALPGRTLLPGLIDMHVHLTSLAEVGGYQTLKYTDQFWTAVGVGNAEKTLRAGANLVVLSIGAFADAAFYERIQQVARECSKRVHLASGAIGGFDVLRTAALMSAVESSITTEKGPSSLKGTPIFRDSLMMETETTEVFAGSAKEAIALFPTKVNVAVATALATAGPDNTRVTIRSVPGFKGDDHRIEVKGEEVHATVDIYSRTSAIAGWSVVALLRNLVSPIVF